MQGSILLQQHQHKLSATSKACTLCVLEHGSDDRLAPGNITATGQPSKAPAHSNVRSHDPLMAMSNTSYADRHTAPLTSYVFLEDAVCWRICWLVEGSASRVTLFRLMPKTSCTSGLYVHVCCTACSAAHSASAPL